MKEIEITKLKKQYPTDRYNIKKSQGSIIVSPKKSVIRVFKYQEEMFDKSGNATEFIEGLLEKTKLGKDDFAQSQVTITKELKDRLQKLTSACKTRRIIFLQRLLIEGLK